MDATADQAHAVPRSEKEGVLAVLEVFTSLGLTCFGEPLAHLRYVHAEGVLPSRR